MSGAGAPTRPPGGLERRLLPLILSAGLAAASCASLAPPALPEWTTSASIDGIPVHLTARDPDEQRARAALAAGLGAARAIGALLLVKHEGSEIDVLTRVPSHLWIEISGPTGDALREAFDIAEETGGAYDPTFPPLVALFGLAPGGTPHTPRAFLVETALRRVDWNDVELEQDRAWHARRLSRRTELDLGALARGEMLDAALAALREGGVPAGRASTIREHVVYSDATRGAWSIEVLVRDGPGPGDVRAGSIDITDGAVAVASRGPVFTADDGTQIHDRFDARTGYPTTGVRWVAVHTNDGSLAGALADAVFALGREGSAFVLSRAGVSAAIQADDGALWSSPGFAFEVRD